MIKRSLFIILIGVSVLSARTAGSMFRIGANTSVLFENGNAYPVIGITAGFYPVNFFFMEGSGEYVFRNDYKEFALPVTANLAYKTRYFQPYAGAGIAYHLYDYSDHDEHSFGARVKTGVTLFDTKGASGSFEVTYDVPDLKGSKGRWYFTGRLDKSFNLQF
jgi:opacity protein-like surface antigen